ncbi:Multifunctional cytochrome P450 monooxygenase af510 [Sparassis crispa]|uniref:Multifunctional cytochrome P450 monooxygenase af510 n=1 Tax=Sparassis crispa TaxID=139825 RepID=A0A401G6K8_9APHY|nr:Multifunctional cytochrome P450 monooxygenase af510 [Sparassis crispa]GBE77800.1 Multifunctional cytochrome P450 monooxygenase af510 [Sparassis crispa]
MAGIGLDWLVALTAIGVVYYFYRRSLQRRRLPPGPRSLPIVGNDLDKHTLEVLEQWPHEYGEIMHLKRARKHMIVLNTAAAAREILDKRSANYSGRPYSFMTNEVMGWKWSFLVLAGEPWRERRAFFQKYFVGQVRSWQQLQLVAAYQMLRRLLESPQNFFTIAQLFAADVVLQMGYGLSSKEKDDPLLALIAQRNRITISRVWHRLVDAFPILAHYPEWMPFSFQRDVRKFRELNFQFRDIPFQQVKADMARGTASPSFVATLLQDLPEDESEARKQEELIRDVAGNLYSAGSDTTANSIRTFILAMTLYPDVQRRVQEELDAVVGTDRLPTFEDRSSLPYIECLLKEVFRWNAIVPLGAFPHASIDDDTYKGFDIPAGSSVTGNLWAILHDPETFPNPEVFNPSRFLGPDSEYASNIVNMAFGWGKRVCPGKAVGEASVFIAVALIAAAFTISNPRDEHGSEYIPEPRWTAGSARRPLPFKCTITCRSSQARSLILALPEGWHSTWFSS